MTKYVNLDDCEVVYCGSDGDYEKYNIPYDMPTADVVPVVRCKDCKHYKQSEVDPSRKMCWRKDVDGWFVCYDFYPTDFCSYGERREDEEV